MFDIGIFKEMPDLFYSFAKELYPDTSNVGGKKKAGVVHDWIRSLEKDGKLLRNYTQNIDTLEKVAGIEKVLYAHGQCILCLPGKVCPLTALRLQDHSRRVLALSVTRNIQVIRYVMRKCFNIRSTLRLVCSLHPYYTACLRRLCHFVRSVHRNIQSPATRLVRRRRRAECKMVYRMKRVKRKTGARNGITSLFWNRILLSSVNLWTMLLTNAWWKIEMKWIFLSSLGQACRWVEDIPAACFLVWMKSSSGCASIWATVSHSTSDTSSSHQPRPGTACDGQNWSGTAWGLRQGSRMDQEGIKRYKIW